jgi:hypothetical protein
MIDKAAYINGKGLSCPFCGAGAGSIHGDFIYVEAGTAFQEMACSECDGIWQDVYHLVDVVAKGGEHHDRRTYAQMP